MANRLYLTADEATNLLASGDTVHNFINPGVGMLVGCDYDREDAIEELRKAEKIEIGGDQCKAMKHAIVCWRKDGPSFFEADMDAVEAFEAAHAETT